MKHLLSTTMAALGLVLTLPAAAQQAPAKPAAAKPAPAEQGRDWRKIDTNNDGYISPEEMETWLKANPGPQK
jgi:EF hand